MCLLGKIQVSMGSGDCIQDLPTKDITIEDVKDYLVPISETMEEQNAGVDVSSYFTIDKVNMHSEH